jgi:ATP-dependent Clp protease ATP-binding subunit ClpX
MIKKRTPVDCTFCNAPATRQIFDKLDFFSNKNKEVYLCEKCFQSFSAGSIIGQFQLNNKILALILGAEDDATILSLKQKLGDYAPASKISLFSTVEKDNKFVSPIEMYEYLSKKVIGQDQAKKRIALTIYEHLKNIYRASSNDKHNILFLGPSGSGKTLIVNSVSKKLNVPYVSTDATSFSPTGFQGADAESCIHDLFAKAEGDIELAQRGVVFIDEIDKLSSNNTGTRLESFNYSTQSTLLKLIEGKRVKLPAAALSEQSSSTHVDTSKILFCFGGAFNGLERIVGKKMGLCGRSIGFRNDGESDYDIKLKTYEMYYNLPHDVLSESLIEYGLSTELVGRIQSIIPLRPLTKEELLYCLLNLEDSPIRRNQLLFAESNINLEFDESYYDVVVEKAMKTGTGARALNSIVKSSVSSAAFEYLGLSHPKCKKVIITKNCVENPNEFLIA